MRKSPYSESLRFIEGLPVQQNVEVRVMSRKRAFDDDDEPTDVAPRRRQAFVEELKSSQGPPTVKPTAIPAPEPPSRPRHASPIPVRHRSNDDNPMCSTDSEEVEEIVEGLSLLTSRRLESMLSRLTLRRERIARCMKLALDHAKAAEAVADKIARAMLEAPIPRKLAILYAMSDILYNTSARVPCAWMYRNAFEPWLTTLFAHWGDILRRTQSPELERNIHTILACWDAWLLWPPIVLDELRHASVQSTNQTEAGHA